MVVDITKGANIEKKVYNKEKLVEKIIDDIEIAVLSDIVKEKSIEYFIHTLRGIERRILNREGRHIFIDIYYHRNGIPLCEMFGFYNMTISVIENNIPLADVYVSFDEDIINRVWYIFYYDNISATLFVHNALVLGTGINRTISEEAYTKSIHKYLEENIIDPETFRIVVESNNEWAVKDGARRVIASYYKNLVFSFRDGKLIVKPKSLNEKYVVLLEDLKWLMTGLVMHFNSRNQYDIVHDEKYIKECGKDSGCVYVHSYFTVKIDTDGKLLFYTYLDDEIKKVISEKTKDRLVWFKIYPQYNNIYPF